MHRYRALFIVLVVISSSIFSFAQRAGFGSQPQNGQSRSMFNAFKSTTGVEGSVHSLDNKPLPDVRVELSDPERGTVVAAVYTNASGNYEFGQLQPGNYRLVATSGLHQVTESIQVTNWTATVNLRLPVSSTARDGRGNQTVSVVQYTVPEKAISELQKAREALEKNKQEQVDRHLAKALEIFPRYADALTLRAVLALNHHEPGPAVDDTQKAIDADGNCPLAYVVMGSALNMEGKFDDALRALHRGQTLAPDRWQTYFEMGKAYIGKTDYASALRELDKAATLAPEDYPLVQLLRADAMLSLKQFSNAMVALESYLKKDPTGVNVPQAQRMLEQARASAGSAEQSSR